MSRRDPKLGDRKPREPVREARVKDGEWVVDLKLMRNGDTLYEAAPLVVTDAQLQNIGSLVEKRCDEIGAGFVSKRRVVKKR